MKSRRKTLLPCLPIVALLLFVPFPASAGEDNFLRLCTFEEDADDRECYAAESETEVEGNAPEGEQCLRWTIEEGESWYALYFELGMDVSGFSRFEMLVKADEAIPQGTMAIRMRTDRTNLYRCVLPSVGTSWRRMSIAFLAFAPLGKPDPKKIKEIAIVGFRSKRRMSLCFDDVRLVKDTGGWRGVTLETMDFEDPYQIDSVTACLSTVEPGEGERKGGTCLVWKIPGGGRASWVDSPLVPRDIRRFESLRFRVKATPPLQAYTVAIRFYDEKENRLGIYLKELPGAWSTVTVPLGFMGRSGGFDPQRVAYIEWLLFRPKTCTLRFDDLELVPGRQGDKSWLPSAKPKIDFNSPSRLYTVHAEGGALKLVGAGRKRNALEWKVSTRKDWIRLIVGGIPEDIRSFETMVITVKADRKIPENTLYLKLSSSHDDYLIARVPAIWPRWTKVKIRLPECSSHKSVDPRKIKYLRLVGWDIKPMTIQIMSLEFLKGRRKLDSWRPTDAELKARVFGDRARKVKEVETEHFLLQTDSRAALGKFAKSLEGVYDFVAKKLTLPPMKKKLPIYIFQSGKTYRNFCVNYAGYSREKAEHTAGHGCGRYFATYFTEPNDPVVAHELTHSLVHRTLGPFGGSWLHEGFAVYVETAFEKRDVVKEFSNHLRNNSFTSLREFIGIRSLAFVESKKDASKASRLYQQAGAFFAFLKEGPLNGKFQEMVETLTKDFTEPEAREKILGKIYGKTLEEIEKAWVEWGTKKR